jgi:hypothetical protein
MQLAGERYAHQAVLPVRRRGRRRRGCRYRGSADGEAGGKSGGEPRSSSCPPSLWSKQVGESGWKAQTKEREHGGVGPGEPGGEKERKSWTQTRDRMRSLLSSLSSLLSLAEPPPPILDDIAYSLQGASYVYGASSVLCAGSSLLFP